LGKWIELTDPYLMRTGMTLSFTIAPGSKTQAGFSWIQRFGKKKPAYLH
jgi:hypothetical protein